MGCLDQFIKCNDILNYYNYLFFNFHKKDNIKFEFDNNNEYISVFGFSCRQLFNTFILNLKKK